ncbi:hypothetical protein QYF36_020150 [Acer negundo]|nr:hypothetical protein QYF36_020150 [Acer negundo]
MKTTDNHSFVKVVREMKGKEEQRDVNFKEEGVSLVLDRKISDGKWLDTCAIRELKNISKVISMKKRLVNRGFAFKMGNFGFCKGESSKVKLVGKRPKLDGPMKAFGQKHGHGSKRERIRINCGPQAEGLQTYGVVGLTDSTSKNSEQQSSSFTNMPQIRVTHMKGPNQIIDSNKEQHVVSFSDNDGRMVLLPLEDPILLPLRNEEGAQIRGQDF